MANFCCWWGEALSPLKVSQENAKSFFEMWNNADSWKSSSGKIVQVSAKREMSNDGLQSNCYKIWRIFEVGEALSPLQFTPKKCQIIVWKYQKKLIHEKFIWEKIHQLSFKWWTFANWSFFIVCCKIFKSSWTWWLMTKKCVTKYSKKCVL